MVSEKTHHEETPSQSNESDERIAKKMSSVFTHLTGVGLDEQSKNERESERQKYIESYEHNQCRRMRDELLKYSMSPTCNPITSY
jgi:5S rRNA maturation endonuclease (ribonuclease M5)